MFASEAFEEKFVEILNVSEFVDDTEADDSDALLFAEHSET